MIDSKWFVLVYEWVKEKTYPEDIKILIQRERDVIRKHKRKIKNIKKSFFLTPQEFKSLKHNRYLINKAERNIKGIKEHYKNKNQN